MATRTLVITRSGDHAKNLPQNPPIMTSVVPSDLLDEGVGTDRRFEAIVR